VATPWILLCEGAGDHAFFRHLIRVRNIRNLQPRARPSGIPAGNTAFEVWLTGLKPETDVQTHSGILVVADNDSDPDASFRSIQRRIRGAGDFGVPEAPRVAAPSGRDLPPVAVLMLPWDDECGCLETLCLRAAFRRRRTLARCIRQFEECVAATDWPISQLSKLHMRCYLSAACPGDPNTGLQYAWTEERGRPPDLIPLQYQCFNQVADYLASLT
jgi:hypothetical protein